MKRYLVATLGLFILGSTALAQCNVGYTTTTRSYATTRSYSTAPTVREVVREVQAPPVREIVREEQPPVVREVIREVEVPVVHERVVFRDVGRTYHYNYNEFRTNTAFRDDGRFREVRLRDTGGGGNNRQLGLFNFSRGSGNGGNNRQFGLINVNR